MVVTSIFFEIQLRLAPPQKVNGKPRRVFDSAATMLK
jgi:hypothetical protein